MEIERINENTVKFYISYIDIEERGFDRDEIWYNRERSEELFWDMMDEVHTEEDFVMEGPLWIQVQALDKGLEILVTKAQLSKDGQKLELPVSDEKMKDFAVDERVEAMLDQLQENEEEEAEEKLDFVIAFRDFEDIISLSKRVELGNVHTQLRSYKNNYYLIVEFPEEQFEEDEIDNILSILLEYGHETDTTIHVISEYGKVIIAENALIELRKYF